MVKCQSLIIWSSLFLQSVLGTGRFTNPAGANSQTSYNLGDPITITWTNTADYDILSLGIFSSNNRTASWLIENSPNHPTSYTWNVNVDSLGFDLSSSNSFQFYIVNGTNFGAPFESTSFNVQSAAVVTVTATVTSGSTNTVVVTTTATPSNNNDTTFYASRGENSYSIGARVGFIVGLVGGIALLLGLAAFFYRRRYGKRSERAGDAAANVPPMCGALGSQDTPSQPEMQQGQQEGQQRTLTEYYSVTMPKTDAIAHVPSVPGPSGQR